MVPPSHLQAVLDLHQFSHVLLSQDAGVRRPIGRPGERYPGHGCDRRRRLLELRLADRYEVADYTVGVEPNNSTAVEAVHGGRAHGGHIGGRRRRRRRGRPGGCEAEGAAV